MNRDPVLEAVGPRLRALRQQRGTALEAGDQAAMTRLDEEEVSVLDDVAYAAEIVNDEL